MVFVFKEVIVHEHINEIDREAGKKVQVLLNYEEPTYAKKQCKIYKHLLCLLQCCLMQVLRTLYLRWIVIEVIKVSKYTDIKVSTSYIIFYGFDQLFCHFNLCVSNYLKSSCKTSVISLMSSCVMVPVGAMLLK